jgi:hypothetical protein
MITPIALVLLRKIAQRIQGLLASSSTAMPEVLPPFHRKLEGRTLAADSAIRTMDI